MEQKNVVMGVTKGTPLEKQMGTIADAEVRGTKSNIMRLHARLASRGCLRR